MGIKSKIFLLVGFVVLILTTIIVFNDTKKQSNDNSDSTDFVSIGFLEADEKNSLPSGDLEVENELNTKLQIGNGLKYGREYLLKIMVNDKFANFKLDGEASNEHLIYFDSYSDRIFDLNIDEFNEGMNQCSIYLIAFPYEQDLTETERMQGKIYTSRFTVNKNSGKAIENNMEKLMNIEEYENPFYKVEMGFFVNRQSFSGNEENPGEVSLEIPYGDKELFVHLSNYYDERASYKIYYLKDWELQKINNYEYLYFKLDPEEKITIPVKTDWTESDVGKSLMIILVREPFQKYEDGIVFIDNSFRFKIVD